MYWKHYRMLVAVGALMILLLCACDSSEDVTTPKPTSNSNPVSVASPESLVQPIVATTQTQAPTTSNTSTTTAQQQLPPTPYPYPTFRSTEGYTSIAKWPSVPFPADVFTYLNEWRRSSRNGKYDLRVYVGAEGQGLTGGDPEQGVLIVMTMTHMPDGILRPMDGPDVYRIPDKVGPVQLVWADYSRLLVVATDDTPFLFDVTTRQWLWPPGAKQTTDPVELDYQARMKAELGRYFPSRLTQAYAEELMRPDPTTEPSPPFNEDDIGIAMGAGKLIEGCENPAAGQPFLRKNCWGERLIDGTDVGLGAGYGRRGYGFDTDKGVIVVDTCPGDYREGDYSGYHRYYRAGIYQVPIEAPTPDAQGRTYDPVRVVDADGELIHLESSSGVEVVFDLAACQWVVPFVPTPTVAPPTFTPVTPTSTEAPWYSAIKSAEEREYVLKMEDLAHMVLTAVAMTPARGTPTSTTTPIPTSTPNYAGNGVIVSGEFPPAPSETFRYRNSWYEMKSGERITVFAGVEGSKGNRVQGMIKVVITSPDGAQELSPPQYYRTPSQSGYVQVVGADGEKVLFRTWNGTEFVFDLLSRRWVVP